MLSPNVDLLGLISASNQSDYFKVSISSPNINMRIDLMNLPANYNISLLNSSGTVLVSSLKTNKTNEVIIRNGLAAGNYVIRVYGASSTIFNSSLCYLLKVKTASTTF